MDPKHGRPFCKIMFLKFNDDDDTTTTTTTYLLTYCMVQSPS